MVRKRISIPVTGVTALLRADSDLEKSIKREASPIINVTIKAPRLVPKKLLLKMLEKKVYAKS
jgi:hypothetical protein